MLIGLMGAGKSTIGRRLAARLDLPFKDADFEIEEAAGLSIQEIFALHGEARFRDGEERVIERILQTRPVVLATGGGAYMSERTRNCIADQGISIWLRAELDVLMRRVRRRGHRPLLQNPDPEGTMQRLMNERHSTYALADIVIESQDAPHDTIVEDVMDALDIWLQAHPA